jgi:hypothetical protein
LYGFVSSKPHDGINQALRKGENEMEGIQRITTGAKYVYHEGKTFVDVSDQIQKYEGPLTTDQMSVYTPSAEEKRQSWRAYFTSGTMLSKPAISQAYKDIEAQMDEAVDQFFAGGLTEDELSETFSNLLTRLSDACDKNGYPTPMGAGSMAIRQERTNSTASSVSKFSTRPSARITGKACNTRPTEKTETGNTTTPTTTIRASRDSPP